MKIYFGKSDLRIAGGQKGFILTTVDQQTILGGITEPKLMTVDGQKNHRGGQKPEEGSKK